MCDYFLHILKFPKGLFQTHFPLLLINVQAQIIVFCQVIHIADKCVCVCVFQIEQQIIWGL